MVGIENWRKKLKKLVYCEAFHDKKFHFIGILGSNCIRSKTLNNHVFSRSILKETSKLALLALS